MQLPQSQLLATELIWLDETPSTNEAMRMLVQENPEQRNRTVIATDTQTAGRGRLGRDWITPPGTALSYSVLLRRREPRLGPSWLPLIAGSAVRRGLSHVLADIGAIDVSLGVKWPNDVLAKHADGSWRKLAGILSEMLPDGSVIVGIGINIALSEAELPTPTATSLGLLNPGAGPVETDAVLAAVLRELFSLLDQLADGNTDGVRNAVIADSHTLGTTVRAILPDGATIEGQAVRLTDEGALVIAQRSDDATKVNEVVVAAGDIQHLR